MHKKELSNQTKEILNQLKRALISGFKTDIHDIILFGSRAKGTATENSDYDILILLKIDYDWKYRNRITDCIYDIELEHEIRIDKHLLSENELNNTLKGCEPIYQNALQEGIYL